MDLENYTDNIYEKIVAHIRHIRKEKDIQQKQMADALGMNQVSYSDAESGKTRFTVTRLFAAIKYLEIDLSSILKTTTFLADTTNEEENIAQVTLNPPQDVQLKDDYVRFFQVLLTQNTTIQEIKEQNKALTEQNKLIQHDLQEIKALLGKIAKET